MNKATAITLLAVCAALLALSGCQQAGGGKPRPTTIAFCFQDLETEFWVAGHEAITKALRDKGVAVIEKNASQDANKQLEQVRDLITQSVDGIILIPQDGQSCVSIIGECNAAGIPIGIFNRPPANNSKPALVVVANNETIAQSAVQYMADEARKLKRKVHPLIMVGDLGDPNAVGRRKGFYTVVEANPDLFETPVEVPTKWDANTALSNLKSAMESNPKVDFVFTSSDFLYPQIKSVLAPLGKWEKTGNPKHVILGGLDGDHTACQLMRDGYVDATGVQDLYAEARMITEAVLRSVSAGEKTPAQWLDDPGFALTQANLAQRNGDMWGCMVLDKSRAADAK